VRARGRGVFHGIARFAGLALGWFWSSAWVAPVVIPFVDKICLYVDFICIFADIFVTL
jgi:hypothetical protein